MKKDEIDLMALKQEIADAKVKVAELNGQKQRLFKQLKDEFRCKSKEEAVELLESLDKEILSLRNQIDQGIKEIEEKYYD